MIGVIVISHAHLASGLLEAARHVLGDAPLAEALDIPEQMATETIREALRASLARCDAGDGALILVDMFGGTPCNVAMEFLAPPRIEIVTGVNAPMLIKALNARRQESSAAALAEAVREAGREYIRRAADLLAPAEGEE